MTPDQLAAARALCEAATPSEWRQGTHDRDCIFVKAGPTTLGIERVLLRANARDENNANWPNDIAFIAAARTLFPQLLAAVEQLQRERDEARAERDEAYASGLNSGIERGTAAGKLLASWCGGEPHVCDQEAIAAAEGRTDRVIIERDTAEQRTAEAIAQWLEQSDFDPRTPSNSTLIREGLWRTMLDPARQTVGARATFCHEDETARRIAAWLEREFRDDSPAAFRALAADIRAGRWRHG